MGILYIGPYRQTDEWGRTARAFARSLARTFKDKVVMRPIWFNNEEAFNSELDIAEYEWRKVEEKDILIQHGLPGYLNYNGDFRVNIAITSIDCNVKNTDWPYHLNLFDKVLVFSLYEKELLIESGITSDIIALEHPPVDIINDKEDLNFKYNGHIYYTSASTDAKSGFLEVVVSYLSQFNILDNVILVAFSDNAKDIEKMIEEIKDSLGIYHNKKGYPNIAIVNRQDPKVLNYAHDNFNTFIDVGYNSGASQNILNSIIYGGLPIVLDTCRIMDDYDLSVKSSESIPYYKKRPLPELYSGAHSWRVPCPISLGKKMKDIYNDKDNALKNKNLEKACIFKNNIFNIDGKIKEVLDLCLQ